MRAPLPRCWSSCSTRACWGAGYEIATRSTLKSKETREIDGVDHYVVRVDISSASHPFYTGQERFLDAAGRIEKFRKKFGGAIRTKKKQAEE